MAKQVNESNQGTGTQGNQTGQSAATGNQGGTATTSASTTPATNPTEGRTADSQNGKSEKTVGLPHVEKPAIVAVRVPGVEDAKEDKPAAPKKSHKKKPENKPSAKSDLVQSVTNLKLMLQVVTELMARKVHPEWHMNDDELDQICNPLSNILARHDMVGTLNEYGDWIALLTACTMIIGAKVLTISQDKAKKKEVKLIANQSGAPTPGSGNVNPKPNQGNVQSTPPSSKQLPPALAAITAF